jgi:hypothetical protein
VATAGNVLLSLRSDSSTSAVPYLGRSVKNFHLHDIP